LPDELCHLRFTRFGPDNGTRIQFIKPGGCAPIGAARPDDFCDGNPKLRTSCFINGDTVNQNSGEPAIVSFNYDGSGKTAEATLGQVGSIWGIAYDNVEENWYYGALVKRHTGLTQDLSGNAQPGAIFVQGPTGAPSLFYNFDPAQVDSVGNNSSRGLAGLGDPNNDSAVFAQVGKAGIGDIEYCPDTTNLFVVTLFDRTVYRFDTSAAFPSPVSLGVPPWISSSPCSNGTARPWALKKRNKKLYVGVVCDASSGNQNNLAAHVYCYDLRTGQWNTTPRLSFPLNYTRQHTNSDEDNNVFVNSLAGAQWHPWEDNFSNWNDFASFGSYAQPILTDIEFDDNGDIILSLGDRGSFQMGFENYPPGFPNGPGGNQLFSYVNAGDVLRAGLDDKSTDPTFTIENNGATAGIHKSKTSESNRSETRTFRSSSAPGTYTFTDPQPSGPGGREFYWGERGILNFDLSFQRIHWETALGALAIVRGRDEVVATVMDPQHNDYPVNSMGIHWLDNSTGARNDHLLISSSGGDEPNGLGKAIALGDVEVCCQPPPIEVGNYVWIDEDEDGIMDPCEEPVENIPVSIYVEGEDGCCTLQNSTTTDASGQYYFGELDPGTTYHIVVGDSASFDTNDMELSYNGDSYTLTDDDQTQTGNTTDPDLIDSDGTISSNSCCASGFPSTTITTGPPGSTDHSGDLGFVPGQVYDLALTKTDAIPNPILPGQSVTFSITVVNQGSDTEQDVTNVMITEYPPANWTLNDPAWPGGVYTIPFLAAGATTNISLVLLAPDSIAVGVYTNYAEVSRSRPVRRPERDQRYHRRSRRPRRP